MASERMNRTMHLVLVSGMMLSFTIMTIGLVMYAFAPAEGTTMALDRIPGGVIGGDPIAVIDLGIVILIATPFVRILAAGITFGMEKDYRFVGISLFVLAMIILAVFIRL
ncbi:MAG TPA: DUF1634 domain-containing protein [Methanomassiliicoccales archaeon]|jgi:uncharacterized membrane protein